MKKNDLRMNLFLGLFMLVGLVMLGAGIFLTVDRKQKMNTYETVRGGIVDYQAREGDNGMLYGAVYAYEVDGKEYTIYDDVFTSKVPRVGERVEVMYDPAAPGEAFVKGAVSDAFLLLLIGGMFVAVPFFILMVYNRQALGKGNEVVQQVFLGLVFAAAGYGLCFGLKQGINFATIFLFLFGSVGVYIIGYAIYSLFKPQKQGEAPLEYKESDWQQEQYYAPDEQYYQGDGLKVQLQREQVEKIEKVGNAVKKGMGVVTAIQRIIAGAVCAGIGGTAMKIAMNTDFTVVGMPQWTLGLFLGIFIVIGLSQVVKGVMELIRK